MCERTSALTREQVYKEQVMPLILQIRDIVMAHQIPWLAIGIASEGMETAHTHVFMPGGPVPAQFAVAAALIDAEIAADMIDVLPSLGAECIKEACREAVQSASRQKKH